MFDSGFRPQTFFCEKKRAKRFSFCFVKILPSPSGSHLFLLSFLLLYSPAAFLPPVHIIKPFGVDLFLLDFFFFSLSKNQSKSVPTSFLHPKEGWDDKAAYDKKAKELAESFHKQMKNFGEFYDVNIEGSPIHGR